jgi:transcription initiation factor IIF auxiliary subunit
MKMKYEFNRPDFEIKSEAVAKVIPKVFKKGGRKHRYVRIYLETEDNNDYRNVEIVQYELHPTFKNRLRLSNKHNEKFEIKIWTYGYFNIKAKILYIDGSTEIISGFVKWS